MLIMQESLANLFSNLFSKPLTLKAKLTKFELRFSGRIRKVLSDSPEAAKIPQELGALKV
jgi:hypothetical protein